MEAEQSITRGTGEHGMESRIVDIAMALMREVKDDIKGMNSKLDDIARERRDEAREHGGLEVRLTTLETAHKSTRTVALTVSGVVIVAILVVILKLVILHPEVMR